MATTLHIYQLFYPLSLFTGVDPSFLLAAKELFRYVFDELPRAQKSSLSNGKETLRRFKVVITVFCFTIIGLNAHSYIIMHHLYQMEKMQTESNLIIHIIVAKRHARSTC